MPTDGNEQRKLAAIMFTDMVGYSATVQKNESLALKLLEEHRRLLRPFFPQFGGQEVKTMGDAFLVEFASALEAVRCAMEMQKKLVEYNASSPETVKILIRIGIHVGDVVHRENDIFGDGVNIAARIEPLAEPGGICLSEDVARQIHQKLDTPITKLGRGELKNIQLPVQVYRVEMPWQAQRSASLSRLKFRLRQKATQRWAAGALIIVASLALFWWPRKQATREGAQEPGDLPKPPTAIVLDPHRLAILPFANLSSDKENEYLSEGITDDIINALTKISGLRVVKGKNVDITKLATHLHVTVALGGSVRKDGNHLRIFARLENLVDGSYSWSNDYDFEMKDILQIQSKVAQEVADALKVQLGVEEKHQLARKPTESPDAYRLYVQGRVNWNHRAEGKLKKALECFDEAIAIDPAFALAYSGLADSYSSQVFTYDAGSVLPTAGMPKAQGAAYRALNLERGRESAESLTSQAFVKLIYEWKWPEAESAFSKALRQNPNYAHAHHWYSHYLMAMGQTNQSLVESTKALELEAGDFIINIHLGWHYLFTRDYGSALKQFQQTQAMYPDNPLSHRYLGLVFDKLKMYEPAVAAFKRADGLSPANSIILGGLGHALAMQGKGGEARKILDDLNRLSKLKYVSPYYQALIHAGLGEKTEALDWLDKAFTNKCDALIYLRQDPWLDNLRDNPRFDKLVERVGLIK